MVCILSSWCVRSSPAALNTAAIPRTAYRCVPCQARGGRETAKRGRATSKGSLTAARGRSRSGHAGPGPALPPEVTALRLMARGKQQTAQQSGSKSLSNLQVSRKRSPKVESLLGSDIFQVHGVLTDDECGRFIDAAESLGFAHQSSRGPRFGEALRDNGRIQVQDEALASKLWEATGLQAICGRLGVGTRRAVGLNPNIRLYRYVKGQHFGRHVDDSAQVGSGQWTAYTLLIYLSKVDSGGETVFYGSRGKQVAAVAPAPGLALLHLHGDHCLEHEAMEVRRGVKYILRSDVVFA